MFVIFPLQNVELIYTSFKSLSLKPMQGNEVVYLTMLAPYHENYDFLML